MTIPIRTAALAVLATTLLAGRAGAQAPSGTCGPDPSLDPGALLERTARTMGLDDPRPWHVRSMQSVSMDYQSDRSYPPFFDLIQTRESWFDPGAGTERQEADYMWPGTGPFTSRPVVASERATYAVADSGLAASPGFHRQVETLRPLDVLAVLHDWRADGSVHAVGTCVYRDYPRSVLEREGPFGPERLWVDPKTGLPVALTRTEPHYLWGQVAVEYLWSTWQEHPDGLYPGAAFRVVDGRTSISRTIGDVERVAPDTAPTLALPPDAPDMRGGQDPFLTAVPPDTTRIAANVVLVDNKFYRSGLALVRDTLFVLDATQGEARARLDAGWAARLFPGEHPVVLVVTDLAWPHIGGLRYWVARGATVVSHRANEGFLRKVLDRRWTLEPDSLERTRGRWDFRFRPVDDALELAGGAIRVVAIDGIGSETSVMAYLPEERFLWAGDFVQTLDAPALYTTEVVRAARRAGFDPERVAAMHLPVTDWPAVAALAPPDAGP